MEGNEDLVGNREKVRKKDPGLYGGDRASQGGSPQGKNEMIRETIKRKTKKGRGYSLL